MADRLQRAGRALFALSLVAYLFTAGGSLTTTDAVVTFDVTRSIVERGSVAMSGNLLGREAERGMDGRYYSPFGIGQSIYNVPFYLAGRAAVGFVARRVGKPDSIPKAVVALGQTVAAAAIVREFFHLAALLVGAVRPAVLAALTLAFASVLWPYSGFGFNQPLAAWTLLAAVRHAVVGTRRQAARPIVWSGCWLAASLLTRHEMVIAAGPIGIWLWLDGRPSAGVRIRRLAAFAPGLVGGIVVWLVYNGLRFGNVLDTGYLRDPTPGFWSPLSDGLAGLLASPSASLFFYSPVAFAGTLGLIVLFRRDRAAAAMLASVAVLFTLFYATLGNWLAGRSYGSRYLVVVLPLLCVGWAAWLSGVWSRGRRVGFAVLFGLGFLIQLPGVLVDYAKVSQSVASAQGRFTSEELQWRWDASPLVLNTRALVRALPENASYVAGRATPPRLVSTAESEDRSFSQQFAFSLDVWWLYLYYLGVLPRWALGLVTGTFALLTGLIWRRGRAVWGLLD